MGLYGGGTLYVNACHYCSEGTATHWKDALGNPCCGACWPAVRDSLGRWGDLRGHQRAVSDAERRIPRGEWKTGQDSAREGRG